MKKNDNIVPEADGRLPYEPPAMESEELFEVLALACGKIASQPRQINCQRFNRNS